MTKAMPQSAPDSDKLVADVEALCAKMAEVRAQIEQTIFGQRTIIDQTLITLLAGGHALLVGVPGLAKTRLTETLGAVLGMSEKRVQFTPDLMPADILGSEVLEESEGGQRAFRFIRGPIFCQLLMADEINRASPRTQSALLQAMQEHEVSIAGERHALPEPFHVIATQNPIEQEGTYPLPEAQLDRFLMQINIYNPSREAEREMLFATTGVGDSKPQQVMSATELLAAQQVVRSVPVGESVVEAILDLVQSGRPDTSSIDLVRDSVSWGPGPRASQALMLASRARAIMDGRLSPSIDDVLALAEPILQHRMNLTFAARADGVTLASVIDRMGEPLR